MYFKFNKVAIVLLSAAWFGIAVFSYAAWDRTNIADPNSRQKEKHMLREKIKTDAEWKKVTEEEWKKVLTPEQYYIMRSKGTERSCSSKLDKTYKEGSYNCAACGLELFVSKTKFNSQTGWPSFYEPVKGNVISRPETDGTSRTEVICRRCESHLGHVFRDGPEPTGLRYCINGVALEFEPAGK